MTPPLPDWAPNVHPLIVHFPIALLFAAVFLDLAAQVFRKESRFAEAADSLFALGAVGVLVAFFTGKVAADEVLLPTAAQAVLTDHADWATVTVWFFGPYALARLASIGYRRRSGVVVNAAALLVAAGGLFLVVQTSEYGARMVFEHGVGVQAVPRDNMARHDCETDQGVDVEAEHATSDDHHREEAETVRPTFLENGSWYWSPGSGAGEVLREDARFISGSHEHITVTQGDSVIAMEIDGGPATFVIGDDLESIEAELQIDIDQFVGSVQLIHHVQDTVNFDFLALNDGMIRQGRSSDDRIEIFDEKALTASGLIRLRAVSDGSHFRGYVGDEMLVHGHSSPPVAGPVGLRLEGTGAVVIRRMGVQSLR